MDFGKILDQWNKSAGPFYDKDAALAGGSAGVRKSAATRRKKLLRKSPDAIIDLHGLTQEEAWNALAAFFNDAKKRGLEKLLVIHGKGNHAGENGTGESGVLKKLARDFIERCPFAGESGYSDGRSGGEGSSWVLLKENRLTVPGK